MRYQGRITRWDDTKGFGQISWHGDGATVFVHIKAFVQGSKRPVPGDIVTYELGQDERGRPRAEKVDYSRNRQPAIPKRSAPSIFPLLLVPVFLAALTGLVWADKIQALALVIYGVASLVTFMAYGFDKAAARKGAWRTSESTLHLFALIGGWPGALLAQRVFRHKSSKASFQIAFWITVGLNAAALVVIAAPDSLARWLPG